MMNNAYSKRLNNYLKLLSKTERALCISAYEEMFAEKTEDLSLKDLSTDNFSAEPIPNPKAEATALLKTYSVSEKKSHLFSHNYFNKSYLLLDILMLLISFMVAFTIYLSRVTNEISSILFYVQSNILPVVLIIPCSLVIYYNFEIYTLKCNLDSKKLLRNIFFSNIVICILIFLFFYLFKILFFPRIAVICFGIIAIILQIIVKFWWKI